MRSSGPGRTVATPHTRSAAPRGRSGPDAGWGNLRLVRNSEIQTFKSCRHRWQWGFVERRQPIVAPLALSFGDLIHISLARYYIPGRRRGVPPAATFAKLYTAQDERLRDAGWYDEEDGSWQDAGELGVRMLEAYVEEYAERDRRYRVIASEQTFQVRLRHPSGFYFVFVGTVDGIWQDLSDMSLLFAEHKTAKAINVDGLALDEQAGGYWTYAPKWLRSRGILAAGELPKKIMYNYLRKAARNPEYAYDVDGRRLNKPKRDALLAEYARLGRPHPAGTGARGAVLIDDMIADLGPDALLLGEISAHQPPPFFAREDVYRDEVDRRRLHARVLETVQEMMAVERLVKAGDVSKAYKNPGPQHLPNCRGCPFRDPCELHETGNDWVIMLDEVTQRWDPYEAHYLVERR